MAYIVHGTLTASTMASVEATTYFETVEVLNRNAAGEIFFTVDGSDAVVEADNNWIVPAAISARTVQLASMAVTTINLISSDACTYTLTFQ